MAEDVTMQDGATLDVLCDIRNRIAFITLNRPAALNALSTRMIIALRDALRRCALDPSVFAVLIKGAGGRAFCAGGDIRALYDHYRTTGRPDLAFFSAEYPLDYLLYAYPKPFIALIDGIVMGGGMGLAQGSRLRIVGERTRMAMPEVAIGFFPDVGASYFLSRLPGRLGLYLALTGVQIGAADALYAGLADRYLPADRIGRLDAALQELSWSGDPRSDLTRLIDDMGAEGGAAPLAAVRPAIDEHFSAPSVPLLLERLQGEHRPEFADWAKATAEIIASRSPTMLAVTLRQLERGRNLSMADCLRMEMGMAFQCFAQGDFIEGVRALIVDKDKTPRWRPARLADVTDAAVEAIFIDPWAGATHPLADLEAEARHADE
jgi:enoyl-CoA hydratase/carnithine racemase